jgi:transposase-like protein
MPPARTARTSGTAAAPQRRHYTAAYKASIVWQYAALDRSGRTALLRAEGLRASLVRQWRGQAEAAVLQALAAEPGGQPVRRVHVSDSLWGQLADGGASLDPPMSPERVIRALCSWWVGREEQPPGGQGGAGA